MHESAEWWWYCGDAIAVKALISFSVCRNVQILEQRDIGIALTQDLTVNARKEAHRNEHSCFAMHGAVCIHPPY